MAIQLSANTQQQQKAPFAAFDSTSRYRSGLSGVAEGLSKVGQLAQQGSNIFAKKDQQAQELLGQEAGNMYTDKLDEWQVARKPALASGNVETIEASDKAFADLNPSNTDWNKYLNQNAGGKLKDKSLGALSASFQTSWDKLDNRRQVDQNQAVIFNQVTTDLDKTNKSVVDIMLESPNGLDAAQFQAFGEKNAYANIRAYHDGLTSPESKTSYLTAKRAPLLMGAKHQLSTAASPEELQSRYDQISEFVRGNPDYNFNPKEIEGLAGEFDKQLKVVSDPAVQVKLAQADLTSFTNQVKGFPNADDGGAAANRAAQFASNVNTALLSDKERKKFTSGLALTEVFIQQDGLPSIAQSQLQRLIITKPENRPSDEEQAAALEKEGGFSFLPEHKAILASATNDLLQTVQSGLEKGDSTAWKHLFPAYKDLLDKGSTAEAAHYYETTIRKTVTANGFDSNLSVFPPFSIRTPTIDFSGSNESIASAIDTSIITNGRDLAALASASMIAANSGGSSDEVNTNLLTATVALAVLNGANPTEVATDFASKLAAYGKLPPSAKKEVDELYAVAQSNLDNPEADSQNILQIPQYMEYYRDSPQGEQFAGFFDSLLKGTIASVLSYPPSERTAQAKDWENRNLVPVFGAIRKTINGTPVQIGGKIFNKYVQTSEETDKWGILSRAETMFDFITGGQPKVRYEVVANSIQNSVLTRVALAGNLNMAKLYENQEVYGLRGLPKETILSTAFAAFSDKDKEEFVVAFARGMGTNRSTLEAGFLGFGAGEGVPISRVVLTNERVLDDTGKSYITKEGYTVEAYNPKTKKYERMGDEKGKPVFVDMEDVMRDTGSFVRNEAAFGMQLQFNTSNSGRAANSMYDIVNDK
tara:strand:- start:5094 stop:7715 length:2622 start_codon:yes stop_codon:yes gene_type:complete